MRLSLPTLQACLLLGASIASAASTWGFDDAELSVRGKGAGVGSGFKEKLTSDKPLAKPVPFGHGETLKISITTTEGKKPKRPHQAFLTLSDEVSGLEESFLFSLKESGKGKVEITHRDVPYQLLTSSKPLKASLTLASFGSSTPYKKDSFTLSIKLDPNVPLPSPAAQPRYAAQPLISHVFRPDPRSPPKIITVIFTLAVLASLPVLFGVWLSVGANLNDLGKAMQAAPMAHFLFFGSIVALEGLWFLYYTHWTLGRTLAFAGVFGSVCFISGSRALGEVQGRRLRGER